MRAKAGEPLKWLQKAIAEHTDDCLLWPFTTNKKGYGNVLYEGSYRNSPRVALLLSGSKPPSSSHQAAHTPGVCHNRLCVNLRHLRWATPSENQQDRFKDGTSNRGEQGSNTLTQDQVIDIIKSSVSPSELSLVYGVTPQTIRDVRNGKSWAWLTGITRKGNP